MSENNSKLFREKSLEQFTSPEQLNDYIRVTNPSLTIALVGVIFLLAGLLVWGFLGNIDAYAKVTARVSNGKISAYVSSADATQLTAESVISINNNVYPIHSYSTAMAARDALSEKELADFGLSGDSLVVAVNAEGNLTDGYYSGSVIMRHLKPIDLLIE